MFTWTGPEIQLGVVWLVATRLEIADFQHVGKVTHASGQISLKDYIENGIGFDQDWTASSVSPDVPHAWAMSIDLRLDERIEGFIKKFIGEMLTNAHGLRLQQGNRHVVVGPALYDGPVDPYVGPCICAKRPRLYRDMPPAEGEAEVLDWMAITGGRYPQHCFECSCGKKWWEMNPKLHPNIWVRVGDPDAWQMLLEYNGVMARRMDFHPLMREYTMFLMQTLRRQGHVPMG